MSSGEIVLFTPSSLDIPSATFVLQINQQLGHSTSIFGKYLLGRRLEI